MFGRASLFLVLGFSSIFLIYTANMIGTATKTVDVFSQYYSRAAADNAALTGAQLGCNAFFTTPGWNAGYSNLSINGGSVTVRMDYLGGSIVQLSSSGTFGTYTKQITIKFQPSSLAKFGNFYSNCTAIPATGDTMDGPIHFNDYCKVYGDPVFLGKVTCKNGIQKLYNPSNPKFLGGYESGVDVQLSINTTQMNSIASSAGRLFEGTVTKPYMDVDITFHANGNVVYKTRKSANGSTWDAWSTPLTTRVDSLAPNGVITIKQGRLYTRGTVAGNLTISALDNGKSGMGNIYMDGNIEYNKDPNVGSINNMLGLVAENTMTVPYNNSRGDIIIEASVLCQTDGLVIERYYDYTTLKSLRLFGGIIAKEVKPTAVYSGSNPVRGFRYIHRYDARFMQSTPPYFPSTQKYEIISWFE